MKYASKAREKIVEALIKSLSEEKIPWKQPWYLDQFYNPTTEKKYTGGVNLISLNQVAFENEFTDPRWMTFNQAKNNGWKVKAGSHGAPIEFWSAYHTVEKRKLSITEANQLLKDDPQAKEYVRIIAKSYTVFNAQQVEGIPELPKKSEVERTDTLVNVEKLANAMGVKQGIGRRACYLPFQDKVILPPLHNFHDEKSYCATFLHELAHATGHETRLNRDIKSYFGTPKYAKEELRAEIASSFMMGTIGVNYDDSHIDNHKAYISSWLEILQKNPEELFKAIKEAEQIQDYMMERYPEKAKDKDMSEMKLSDNQTLLREEAQSQPEHKHDRSLDERLADAQSILANRQETNEKTQEKQQDLER